VLDKLSGVEGSRLLTPAEKQAGYKIAAGKSPLLFCQKSALDVVGRKNGKAKNWISRNE